MKNNALFMLLMLLWACAGKQPADTNDIGGYAGYGKKIPCMYVRLTGLSAHENGFGHYKLCRNQKSFMLMLDYDSIPLSDEEDKAFRASIGEDKGKYLHSDADPGGFILCNKLDRIVVTSTADFNDVHAGESLGSKIMFFSWTVWPSIKEGKDVGFNGGGENNLFSKYFYYNPIPSCRCYCPLTMQLDALSNEDLYYIGAADRFPTLFLFTEIPAIKQHVFTVSYFEGGRNWSIDIPADFGS